jgi:hypothetical protein
MIQVITFDREVRQSGREESHRTLTGLYAAQIQLVWNYPGPISGKVLFFSVTSNPLC